MARTRSVDDKMPFMEHLGELRVRIMRSLYSVLVGLVIAFPFSERITEFLMRPVTTLGHKLVFTAPAEAFWVQMKVALITGVFISAPGILWQVWAFIAPGLHKHERKYAAPFVIIGSLMFVGGGAFALLVVTPYAIEFLLSYARATLQPMITIENHVGFILKFTLAFGLVFELPLILTILARMGVVTPKMLARNRKYAILGAFIIANPASVQLGVLRNLKVLFRGAPYPKHAYLELLTLLFTMFKLARSKGLLTLESHLEKLAQEGRLPDGVERLAA